MAKAADEARRRWWLLAVPLGGLLVLAIGFHILRSPSGVQVVIQNTGSTPLHSVVLHVTGGSYPLGDVAAGGSVDATVSPKSFKTQSVVHLVTYYSSDLDGPNAN